MYQEITTMIDKITEKTTAVIYLDSETIPSLSDATSTTLKINFTHLSVQNGVQMPFLVTRLAQT